MTTPFCPTGGTFALTVDQTSNRIELVGIPNAGRAVRIANSNASGVALRFGDSNVSAVVIPDMYIAGNTVEIFIVPGHATHLAAIASSAGNALKVTVGQV